MCLGIWLFATAIPCDPYCFRGTRLAVLAELKADVLHLLQPGTDP
jgi:hypothetical protein